MKSIIIHINCSDQTGIIATFTGILFDFKVNILNLEQHVESDNDHFFMRIHAELEKHNIVDKLLYETLELSAKDLNAKIQIYHPEKLQRVAIFTTKESIPLYDLLIKNQSGEILCEIPFIISNHKDHEEIANQFEIPFYYIPITNKTKTKQEKEMKRLLKLHRIDLIVLARYMQILSPEFVAMYYGKIINIHHGFLPAFKGKNPYHQAWKQGVKMIGATAHYVTADLDEGPIIDQDVVSIDHQHSIKELIQSGREIERRVLTYAVKSHLEYRIILNDQRTIIFRS